MEFLLAKTSMLRKFQFADAKTASTPVDKDTTLMLKDVVVKLLIFTLTDL